MGLGASGLAQPQPRGLGGPRGRARPLPRPWLQLVEEMGLWGHGCWGRPLSPPAQASTAVVPSAQRPLFFAESDCVSRPSLFPSSFLCSLHHLWVSFCFLFVFHLLFPPRPFLRPQHPSLSSLSFSLLFCPSPRAPSHGLPSPVVFPTPLPFLFLAVCCPLSPSSPPRALQSLVMGEAQSLRNLLPAWGPCPGEWASKPAQPGALLGPNTTESLLQTRRMAQKGRQRTQSPRANARGGSPPPRPRPSLPRALTHCQG